MRRTLTIALISMVCASAAAEKDHYAFTLPAQYVGWVRIIFEDSFAAPLMSLGKDYKAHLIQIPEEGVFRTSSIRTVDTKPKDVFFYRISLADGSFRLEPIPPNYIVKSINDGGFDITGPDANGGGQGWYIFIGPPELRSQIPFADWKKELQSRKAKYGTDETGPPEPLPKPGRISMTINSKP